MLNLDTHILVAVLEGRLSKAEELMVDKESLVVSDIVLWEIAMLVRHGRLDLDLDSVEFRRSLRYFMIVPITLEIARQSTALDFRSDPADEIIAATSIVERIPLLTRDRKILRSRLVPLAG
ncbi:MAG TPA: type II toxin-antitoxin system VapC family toxin [Pyrinomonadaceae bacterium]|nr:type II toxin-antitoxin system VapC family toxin [Pyrinomonadaceae bacterium]